MTIYRQSDPIKISPAVIWGSSIFLGLLSSVPQFAEHQYNLPYAVVNAVITSAFALLMWYFNIYMLTRPGQPKQRGMSYRKLLISLAVGLAVMLGLAFIQQLIITRINFGPVMLMIEV